MSYRDDVANFMMEIKGRTPILLIARAARIFRGMYSGRIYNLRSEDDMQDLYNMSISKLRKAAVVSDLSEIYNDEDLLKLIEETTLNLILLASKDNLSDTIMSRCKSTLKISELDVEPCTYIDETSALSSISTMSIEEGDTFLCHNCPELVKDMSRVKTFKYKDKLTNILANIHSRKEEN